MIKVKECGGNTNCNMICWSVRCIFAAWSPLTIVWLCCGGRGGGRSVTHLMQSTEHDNSVTEPLTTFWKYLALICLLPSQCVKGWLAAARWRNPSHCQQPPPSVILAAADLTSSRHFSREVWEISGEMWSGAIFAAECRCLVLSCILCSQHYNSPIVK